ncbi:MAG: capsule assembly Wzi family protein [candidate division WOR-3 bacterium]
MAIAVALVSGTGIDYVPSDSRVYDDFDLLKTSGLIASMPYTSRPWTRRECVRLLAEALEQAARRELTVPQQSALQRLLYEFGEDIDREDFRRPLVRITVPDVEHGRVAGDLFSRAGICRWRQHDSAAGSATRDRRVFSVGAVLNNRPRDRFALYERAEIEVFSPRQRDVWDSTGCHLPGSRAAGFHEFLKFEIEHAYLAWLLPWVRFELGRDRMRWGPGYLSSAMLSDQAPSFDHIQLSASYTNFRFISFTSILSNWNRKIHRFLSAQRVEASLWHRLTLGAAMMNVYSWESLSIAPIGGFVNPLLPGYLEAANSYHWSNLLVGFDANLYMPSVRGYCQLMIDNYEFNTRGVAPNCVATQAGLYWAPNIPVEVRIEYASVTAFTYYHRLHFIMYENYGVPLGHELGPDADRWWARLRFVPAGAVQLGVWSDFTRRGFYNRGDYRRKSFWYESESLHTPLPTEFPSLGRDPSGNLIEEVDRTWRVGPEIEWWAARRLRLSAGADYWLSSNFNGEIGLDRGGFEWNLRVEYRY